MSSVYLSYTAQTADEAVIIASVNQSYRHYIAIKQQLLENYPSTASGIAPIDSHLKYASNTGATVPISTRFANEPQLSERLSALQRAQKHIDFYASELQKAKTALDNGAAVYINEIEYRF